MQVVVDNLFTNYVRFGRGKTLVLLHGWGDSAQGLSALAKALADSYEVITIDLPGFGKSESPAVAWSLVDYAIFVRHFLDKIGIENVYSVVGHSNGGAIAIKALASNIISADKLVLLASSGVRNSYSGRKGLLKFATKSGKILTRPLPLSVRQKLQKKVYKTLGSDFLVAPHLADTFKNIVSEDLQEAAKTISQPSLLIYGEQDQDTPISYAEIFYELIDTSTLVILPGAGHFVHLDRPKDVEQQIRDFLA